MSITDNVNTASQTFEYDALNRLVEAQGGYGTRTYQYDEIGNIVAKDDKFYSYAEGGAGPHAVTSLSDGTTFTYDANGNMLTKVEAGVTTAYTYDAENRLTKVVKNGSVIGQYEYDGDGGRTKKTATVSGQTTTTTFVGSLFETDSKGRSTKYVFLGGQRVAAVTSSPAIGTTVLYYHSDHLGGANVLTDATGFKKELIEYEPFGQESRHEKYGSSEEVAWYYFTGKKLDDESGLYYFGARYYDPTLGRFLTPDIFVQTSFDPQSLNRYTYARNNPVNLIDPDGHFWFFAAIAAIFKAASAYAVAHPIIAGAVAGGILGGANAAISGTNIAQGIGLGVLGGAIGGAVGLGVGSFLDKGVGTFWAGMAGSALGGASAGAAVTGVLGGDVGMGALAGFAGGIAGFMGSYNIAPSAGSILGSVASAGVSGQDLGRAALGGFIDASIITTFGLMSSESTIGAQGTPEGGDLIFYKGGGFTDPVGLFLSYLQGAPIAHNAIATNATKQVDSHVKGGVKERNIRFDRQGRLVKWAGTGNQKFVALAVQYGKENAFKYGAGPGREICSTFCGRVAKESGLSLSGFSPSSQYSNLQGAQYYNTYGIQGR